MADILPSKKFLFKALASIGALGLIIYLVKFPPHVNWGRTAGVPIAKVLAVDPNITVNGLVDTDSNGNGIPDWKEALYGLDPTKPTTGGISNKSIIEARQAAANTGSAGAGASSESTATDDTDQFTRQFFSTIISLKQSGALNEAALANLGASFSDAILGGATLSTTYTKADLTIVSDTKTKETAYRTSLGALAKKYTDRNFGTEMKAVADALATGDPRPLSGLPLIAADYTSLARDLKNVSVPSPLATSHLALVNSYQNLGETTLAMDAILDNPIIGMRGVLLYKQALDAVKKSNDDIQFYFSQRK